MRVLVCIDDTDDLHSKGTGALASELAERVQQKGWGNCSYVTRHQLYVHPDIPYTSHNSAMCFTADISESSLQNVIDHAASFLASESAPGSDPGLCVGVQERIVDKALLVSFGHRAKQMVLAKEDAYALARETGVHLSEHGGTGQGVIGALAGMALRLSGNDGRLKGQIHYNAPDGITTAGILCSHDRIESVETLEGIIVEPDAKVRVEEKLKTVLLRGKSVLLVSPLETDPDVQWQTYSRQQLLRF